MPRMIFIDAAGGRREVAAPAGETLLTIAQRNGFDVEGTCEGSLACATCHLIVAAEWYGRLAPPGEDEAGMLELAWGLTATSRLGCQIVMSEALDGLVVALPGGSA